MVELKIGRFDATCSVRWKEKCTDPSLSPTFILGAKHWPLVLQRSTFFPFFFALFKSYRGYAFSAPSQLEPSQMSQVERSRSLRVILNISISIWTRINLPLERSPCCGLPYPGRFSSILWRNMRSLAPFFNLFPAYKTLLVLRPPKIACLDFCNLPVFHSVPSFNSNIFGLIL